MQPITTAGPAWLGDAALFGSFAFLIVQAVVVTVMLVRIRSHDLEAWRTFGSETLLDLLHPKAQLLLARYLWAFRFRRSPDRLVALLGFAAWGAMLIAIVLLAASTAAHPTFLEASDGF